MRPVISAVFLCLVSALVGSTPAQAGDWPQLLGPDRTGMSDETGIAAGWKKGPTERWRVAVGRGYGSVAVVDGVVHLLKSEPGSPGDAHLLALDAATGAERWRTRVGDHFDNQRGYAGTRSTPVVVGDQIVALGAHGDLVSVDRTTGAEQWRTHLVDDHGGVIPQWGYATSPLVHDGLVYLATGNTSGGGLLALDLATGEKRWSTGSFAAGYASPIHATLDGVEQIVFFNGFGLVGVTPNEGKELWKHRWRTDYDVNAATPVVIGSNRLFVASAYGVGGAALLVDAEGKVLELWKTKRMKNKVSTSIFHDGHLYGFNEDRLTALDASTGEEVWAHSGYGRGVLLYADGHLVVQSEGCDLQLVPATPKGHRTVGDPVDVLTSDMECWGAPALAHGTLYVRDHADLVALEVRPVGPTPPAPTN